MKNYILTGTPGCGKTGVIKELEAQGYSVIHEAATHIISQEQQKGNNEPWKYPNFIDNIINLQKKRQADHKSAVGFYDRSPICTYALAVYLGFQPSAMLLKEIDQILAESIYEKSVFFLDNLGFIENTDARKIRFEEALKFEQIHLNIYEQFGYEIIKIPALSIQERTQLILKRLNDPICFE
ncbi:MAG: ATPase [Gammaproteobacteria bacterium]|nr:ATPase [Gammaproteobacteria bacterium]